MTTVTDDAIPSRDEARRNQLKPVPLLGTHGRFCPQHIQGGEQLLRLPQLQEILGISRATIYRYVNSGKLPAPVKLSAKCVAWRASAINQWLATLDARTIQNGNEGNGRPIGSSTF
jgi:prophage regulatory protein